MSKQDITLAERMLIGLGMYNMANKRMLARYTCNHTRSMFESSKTKPGNADWVDFKGDINDAWQSSNQKLVERARGLAHNDPYGMEVHRAIVRGSIGQGIKHQFRIDFFPHIKPRTKDQLQEKQQLNAEANRLEEENFRRWAEDKADAQERSSYFEHQAMGLGTAVKDGDFFKVKVVKSVDNPLSYMALEYDRVSSAVTDKVEAGNEIINGIEIDKWGAVQAYHVLENSYRSKSIRILKQDMIHLYKQDTPSMLRGLTWYTPIIEDLNHLRGIKEYALIARKVQSAIALVISNRKKTGQVDPRSVPGMGLTSAEQSQATSGTKSKVIMPGLIHNVGDADVHSHIPAPSHDLADITKLLLRGVGAGIGLSYELVSNDFSNVSFSSGRLSQLKSMDQNNFIHSFFTRRDSMRVHRDYVDMRVMTGAINPNRVGNIYGVSFTKPKVSWGVNPSQEMDGIIKAVRHGASTMREQLEQRGYDWDDHQQGVMAEMPFMEEVLAKYMNKNLEYDNKEEGKKDE